jgi:hypothetical protein
MVLLLLMEELISNTVPNLLVGLQQNSQIQSLSSWHLQPD